MFSDLFLDSMDAYSNFTCSLWLFYTSLSVYSCLFHGYFQERERESNSRIANVWPSVHLSVIKTPQPLRIMVIVHHTYQPSCLSAIMPISHHAYQPSCLSVIVRLGHPTYQLSALLLLHLSPFGLFLKNYSCIIFPFSSSIPGSSKFSLQQCSNKFSFWQCLVMFVMRRNFETFVCNCILQTVWIKIQIREPATN